jgi:hypothetical protein
VFADGRIWIGGVIRLIGLFVPGFLEPWVNTYADNAFYFLVLAVMIWVAMRFSSSWELRLRDRARRVWRQATNIGGPPGDTAPPTRLQRFRNAVAYQRGLQRLKWQLLPFAVVVLTAVLGAWLLGGALTQTALPLLESGRWLCPSAGSDLPEITDARLDFSARRLCHAVGGRVVEGQRYVVTFEVGAEWRDSSHAATPKGLDAGDIGLFGYLGVPLRRVVNARYLQPAIEIRRPKARFGLNAVYIYPLELELQGGDRLVYRGEFEAARDGELLLFANDAVLLGDLPFFYERSPGFGKAARGNAGTACVAVRRSDIAADRPGLSRSDECGTLAQRATSGALTGEGR